MCALVTGVQTCALPICIASAEGWPLPGFGGISVRNDYVTPRGLVVTTSGAAVQVLNGLVAVSPGGVAFHGGTWVDLNPGYSKADGKDRTRLASGKRVSVRVRPGGTGII